MKNQTLILMAAAAFALYIITKSKPANGQKLTNGGGLTIGSDGLFGGLPVF